MTKTDEYTQLRFKTSGSAGVNISSFIPHATGKLTVGNALGFLFLGQKDFSFSRNRFSALEVMKLNTSNSTVGVGHKGHCNVLPK